LDDFDWEKMKDDLNRFLEAQEKTFETALSEIQSGKKRSHWMWYVFPQYKGLGMSDISKYYAIQDIQEAKAYLSHPLLGRRLKAISGELLKIEQTDAHEIFGSPDDMKLHSCMTLFAQVADTEHSIFEQVIDKFFNGNYDQRTMCILQQEDK